MNDAYKQKITLKPRILRLLLEQCLLQESVEVQTNKHKQVYYSRIIDHLPGLKPNMEEDELSSFIKTFAPFSYLKQEQCLLLEPPVSDDAKAQIKKGDHLFIRFFTGHFAYETDVSFERFIEVQGKQVAIQVGFPTQLGVIHIRKHIRVKALIDSKIMIKVKAESLSDFNTRIMELSASGLSFCIPHQFIEKLPIASKASFNISVLGEDDLVLEAYIRHFNKMSEGECCAKKTECDVQFGSNIAICGVDFVPLDDSQKMRVNDMIFLIQREYLIKEKEDLIKFNENLEKQVQEKTGQLREKDIQLLEMDRIAGIATLAAGIAHEINNPLSFVKSSISFVKKGVSKLVGVSKFWDDKPVPEPVLKDYKEYLSQINFEYLINTLDEKFDRIKKGIERIMHIIVNLKSFSRVDKENMGEIDINKSVEEAVKIITSKGLENVEFVKEFQEIPLIECFPNDIHQCLLHIIQNAVDAVEDNGIIKISSAHDKKDEHVLIRIIDNGKGMSPEVLRQAMNPFFTTKPVGSGTGVGLSIIERIIKHHGGKIELSSKVDLGTTVTITLPVSRVLKEK